MLRRISGPKKNEQEAGKKYKLRRFIILYSPPNIFESSNQGG
jgi:hypothetical protein